MENPRRGRGSFVDIKRKSLTFNNIFNEDNEQNSSIEKPKHTMKSYLASLTKEKQEWKDIFKRKKHMCKDIKGKYKFEPLTINKNDVEKYITAEDKKFFQNKPNYVEMVKSVGKYVDAINYLHKYKLDITDYYDKACHELGTYKKLLVDDMCADDLCETCNIKNCQMPDHKFVI